MKNVLLNIFPRNPTQTKYRRFQRIPGGEWNTEFDKTKRDFEKFKKPFIKNNIGELP